MLRTIQRAGTSRSIQLFIRSTASTPAGQGLTGLTFSAGPTVYYTRLNTSGVPLAAPTAITLATQTATGAWSSGGFVAMDGTNAPGLYRLDLPDAALATGAAYLVVSWKGTNVVEDCTVIELPDYDALSAPATTVDANVVSISGDTTAADNLEAAADGTGYNLGNGSIVAASVTGAVGSVTGAVGSVTGAVGSVTGNVGGNVVGSVASVTGNVGGNVVGSVASVTARVTANSDQIAGSATSATNIAAGALGVVTFTVGASATTTSVTSNLTSTVTDLYKDRWLVITSGTAAGEAKQITAYNGTTKTLTVNALPSAPANGVTAVIV